MQEIIVSNLKRMGHLNICRIVPDKINKNNWNLEFKSQDDQGGEISVLETQRGAVRAFSSLDTAFRVAQKLGFNRAIVFNGKK